MHSLKYRCNGRFCCVQETRNSTRTIEWPCFRGECFSGWIDGSHRSRESGGLTLARYLREVQRRQDHRLRRPSAQLCKGIGDTLVLVASPTSQLPCEPCGGGRPNYLIRRLPHQRPCFWRLCAATVRLLQAMCGSGPRFIRACGLGMRHGGDKIAAAAVCQIVPYGSGPAQCSAPAAKDVELIAPKI